MVGNFPSQDQGDFDDEAANSFKQDRDGRHLRKNGRMFVTPDFRLVKDAKIFFGGRVRSFRGGSQSLKFLVAFGSTDHFGNQSWKFDGGHMLAESVIVNPVRAVMSELDNCIIF